MISEVVMPQMGADMTEGTLLRWLKQEGEQVERGEIIAEIETDKANIEIEAFGGGVFRMTLAEEGDIVQVGEVIAVIGAPEDDLSKYGTNGAASAAPAKLEKSTAADQAAQPSPEATARADAPPSAGVAAAPTVEATPTGDLPPTPPPPDQQPATAGVAQPPPAPVPAPGPSAPPADGRVRASPLARRIADERGIDLASVRGTGPGGRVVKKDVESFRTETTVAPKAAAAAPGATAPRAPAPPPAPASSGPDTVVEQSKMRQRIAARMAQSKREAPHYYLLLDIDMTDAMSFRSQANATLGEDARVSVNDLIVRACALALQQHPALNATISNDQVTQHGAQHICIAVALDDGLIAPAIVNAGAMTLRQIAVASRDLADRARNGALRADEVSAGTFTISNLGAFGVETLVAIIQPPQTAILGTGTVAAQAVVRDGEVVVRQMMKVALSADHRVTDGAQGARFIADIKRLLETPLLLVL